jgi:hypothetical protein
LFENGQWKLNREMAAESHKLSLKNVCFVVGRLGDCWKTFIGLSLWDFP